MTTQQDYETLYGVGLLDDLHNYFPAILYDSGRFHSVSELLTYIQQSARNRFDLFSFGQRAYISHHAPPPPPPRAPRTTISATLTSILTPLQSSTTVPVTHIDLSGNHMESETDEEETNQDTEEEEDTHTIPPLHPTETPAIRERQFSYIADPLSDNQALNLINLLIGGLNTPSLPSLRTREINLDLGSLRLPTQFMEPVIVHPTEEQIEAGSTRAFPPEVTPCSICQEDIQINEMGRRLKVCGHTFHIRCIDRWFNENVHCPICRHDIRDTNTTTNNEQS